MVHEMPLVWRRRARIHPPGPAPMIPMFGAGILCCSFGCGMLSQNVRLRKGKSWTTRSSCGFLPYFYIGSCLKWVEHSHYPFVTRTGKNCGKLSDSACAIGSHVQFEPAMRRCNELAQRPIEHFSQGGCMLSNAAESGQSVTSSSPSCRLKLYAVSLGFVTQRLGV